MTAPSGVAPPDADLVVTDETAPAVARWILSGSPVDPRVVALCRWAADAGVAALRRALSKARTEAELARDDFCRLRALRADHAQPPGDPDTIDEALPDDPSDAVPILLDDGEDETTSLRAARTIPALLGVRAAPGRSASP